MAQPTWPFSDQLTPVLGCVFPVGWQAWELENTTCVRMTALEKLNVGPGDMLGLDITEVTATTPWGLHLPTSYLRRKWRCC